MLSRVSLRMPHSVLQMEILPSFEMARQILLLKGRPLSPPQLYFSFIEHAQVYNYLFVVLFDEQLSYLTKV